LQFLKNKLIMLFIIIFGTLLFPIDCMPVVCRGFGYIEFETPAAVDEAVSAMNLFDLGGIHLRVGKVLTYHVAGVCRMTSCELLH